MIVMMRATRPVLAAWRSVNSATLLALGSAAVSVRAASGTGATRQTGQTIDQGRVQGQQPGRSTTHRLVAAHHLPDGLTQEHRPDGEERHRRRGLPSRSITLSTGPGKCQPLAPNAAPSAMPQGMGLPSTARRAWPKARRPLPRLAGLRERQAQRAGREQVHQQVQITGPIAPWPSRASNSGTPMKPELGKAATSAPKAASLRPPRQHGHPHPRATRPSAASA